MKKELRVYKFNDQNVPVYQKSYYSYKELFADKTFEGQDEVHYTQHYVDSSQKKSNRKPVAAEYLFFDIDGKFENGYDEAKANDLISKLANALDIEVSDINVVWSGYGLHCFAGLSEIVEFYDENDIIDEAKRDQFFANLKALCEKINSEYDLGLDVGYTSSQSRLTRLPGTNNTKVK
jgi:hypothetical protein